FNQNYTADSSYGTPASITVTQGTNQVQLSTSVNMPTDVIKVADILSPGQFDSITVGYTSTVVWGQTKLWVSLVLDNTGSMTQTDSTGTSKISALKTAVNQLLGTLQSASATPGDVMAAIIPFSKDVNVGTSNVNQTWIDWTDWSSAPPNSMPSSSVGPGSSCPYSSYSNGYTCQVNPTNGSSTTSKIPSSGSYSGYICPTVDNGNVNSGRMGRYYNGCYNSVDSTQTVSSGKNASCSGYSNCSCSGSGKNKVCTQDNGYTHTWIVNDHSTWSGCVMDRTQDYDIGVTAPTSTTTDFPAENAQSCVPTVMLGPLSDDRTGLTNEVNSMTAGGSTNQPIGLAWGWQAQTNSAPLNAGTLPANTSQYIILVSDGLNTQDRWYGDGSDESTQVDARMNSLCTSAKAAGIVIYTIYIDLNGTQGNSTVLQNCATDSTKYFDLQTSGAIITTLNSIAQQITQLRVSK
ncbi:MAG TPA: VWA domain-containing protein, partial [Rhizomicrobium sp.]|nr:VWA domain-containing protein [Rhizomicrobium sp.]